MVISTGLGVGRWDWDWVWEFCVWKMVQWFVRYLSWYHT